MGVWNFYIEIKADDVVLNGILNKYAKNNEYREILFFSIFDNGYADEYTAGFSCVIDNFLPANHMVYKLLSDYLYSDVLIRTKGIERKFDFKNKSDFIKFMYDVWESNIDHVYENFGVIVVNNVNYYKIRNKLYKKYYKLIPKSIR